MHQNRHSFIEQFTEPVYSAHSQFSQLSTFACLTKWCGPIVVELPRFSLHIQSIDYFETLHAENQQPLQMLHFQQDSYRLWYQIDGIGILQNATKKSFGTARPGLLGVMDHGERHTYLHQRGHFSAFQICFTIQPSLQAKCYWNAEIEGKTVLDDADRSACENAIFSTLFSISQGTDVPDLIITARLLEIISPLFTKGLIGIEDTRFPKNKVKSLVAKARNYMNVHYAGAHHQRELEKECSVDINYLNILFKKEAGQTLYAYLTSVRMEHAKHLLTTTVATINEIASKTGYPNANSFSRAFKRCEKSTPLEFRNRQQSYIHNK